MTGKELYRNEEAGITISEINFAGPTKRVKKELEEKSQNDALALADRVYKRFMEGATLEQIREEIRGKKP